MRYRDWVVILHSRTMAANEDHFSGYLSLITELLGFGS